MPRSGSKSKRKTSKTVRAKANKAYVSKTMMSKTARTKAKAKANKELRQLPKFKDILEKIVMEAKKKISTKEMKSGIASSKTRSQLLTSIHDAWKNTSATPMERKTLAMLMFQSALTRLGFQRRPPQGKKRRNGGSQNREGGCGCNSNENSASF